MGRSIAAKPVPVTVQAVAESVIDTSLMLFYDVAHLNAQASPTLPEPADWLFFQPLGGSPPLVVGYELPSRVVLAIASSMLQTAYAKVDELALDAACELLNTIVGNAAARLARSGADLRPEPPRCLAAGATIPFRIEHRAPLECEAGTFAIVIAR